jgi:hypothetical protein
MNLEIKYIFPYDANINRMVAQQSNCRIAASVVGCFRRRQAGLPDGRG